ncbi:MAG: peptidase S8/S53 domain-containing protein, partial [Podila humilis]
AYIIEYSDGVRRNAAHNSLKANKVDYKVRNEYNIFNGAALTVKSGHEGDALAKIPGIKNVWRVTLHKIPKVNKSTKKPTDPEVVSFHHMTGVDVLHKKHKLTGKGIKIGIIDTGVDYKHPAFAVPGANEGCFARNGKNCRVKYGWDFVGDDYNGSNTPKPDGDPMDCNGHGSHVAGIIGGNALNIKVSPKPPQPFVGVAPEVTIGAYRVFGCYGTSSDDVILAAMELAFNEGMDVINMSLGGSSSYKSNPTAILADKLVARGMALAAGAGNEGTDGNAKSRITWSKGPSTFTIENGGSPSVFSSFGLDGELRSKPDLAAPGGNILSTYTLADGGYTVLSGTSMASPYIAGAHALYMQAKNAKSHGDEIRRVFKNTATISSNHGSKTKASAAKQGAGLINVLSAIMTTTSISPDHIDLLDSKHFKKSVKISIKNHGKHTETYTLS